MDLTALTTALTAVKTDALAALAAVAPIAIAIFGAFLVWKFGIKYFSIYIQYQEAYAFYPFFILVEYAVLEAVAIVGTLLCAAGLTWAANTAIEYTCDWFCANCVPEIKQGIADMISAASNGITDVSDEVWNYARDWVQSNFIFL